MNPNGILATIAQQASVSDWPMSGITAILSLQHTSAMLVINWLHFDDDGDDCVTQQGVLIRTRSRVPPTCLAIPPTQDLERQIIDAAWRQGAWDINRVSLPSDPSSPLPPYVEELAPTLRPEGYTTWYWRPMMRGPELRAKAHAHKDTSLNLWTLGRDTSAPSVIPPAIKPGRSVVIRLGNDARKIPAPAVKADRPATVKQRGYLGRLLRVHGDNDRLPRDLTAKQASEWIDRIKSAD
jgi:hypothetical protein